MVPVDGDLWFLPAGPSITVFQGDSVGSQSAAELLYVWPITLCGCLLCCLYFIHTSDSEGDVVWRVRCT